MEKAKQFEDLIIWQEARELCKKVYVLTSEPPFSHDTRFVQQIRASAGSIMDNIAEGFERTGNKELINFLFIAKGSCGEVRSQIIRALDAGHIDTESATDLYHNCKRISALVMNMIKEIRNSGLKGAKYSPQDKTSFEPLNP